MDEELVEILAKIEHKQWSHWVQYMEDNWNYINLTKWLGQSVTPYDVLPEEQKESDREWARYALEAIEKYHSSKESANK